MTRHRRRTRPVGPRCAHRVRDIRALDLFHDGRPKGCVKPPVLIDLFWADAYQHAIPLHQRSFLLVLPEPGRRPAAVTGQINPGRRKARAWRAISSKSGLTKLRKPNRNRMRPGWHLEKLVSQQFEMGQANSSGRLGRAMESSGGPK